jgi:hypothetical protein
MDFGYTIETVGFMYPSPSTISVIGPFQPSTQSMPSDHALNRRPKVQTRPRLLSIRQVKPLFSCATVINEVSLPQTSRSMFLHSG